MKKFLSVVLGFGSPMDFAVGLVLILLGLITLGDGRIGIQTTPTSKINWITAFAVLPNWFGWMFIWFGIDSFFGGKMTKFLYDKILSPILNPFAVSIVGEERLKRWQGKLEGKSKPAKWIRKTYGNAINEESMNKLALMSELKVELPELFDYFYQATADRLKHDGITEEMISETAKYYEKIT